MEISYSILRTIKTSNWVKIYGQRDPLIEYKKEAFDLFENLLSKLKLDFITILFNLKVINQSDETRSEKKNDKKIANNPKCLLIFKKNQKISRNDRCEVTGKKFKNCSDGATCIDISIVSSL